MPTSSGTVTDVQVLYRQSETTADAGVGDTVLAVESAAPFDAGGGTLMLGETALAYTTAEGTTVTLAEPLTELFETGLPVFAIVDDEAAQDRWAEVRPDDPEAKSIRARVPTPMYGWLPVDRDYDASPVEVSLVLVGTTWEVTDRPGGGALTFAAPVRNSDDEGTSGGLNEYGDVTARNVSYQGDFDALGDTFLVDGMPIGELLSAFLPRGVGPKGGVWGQRTPTISGQSSEYGLLEVAWQPPADCTDRLYRITATSGAHADTVDTTLTYRIRYTTDGTAPTITSPVLASFESPIRKAGAVGARRVSGTPIFEPSVTADHRFLLTLAATDPTSAKWTTAGVSEFLLEDLGWKDGNAAASNAGGATLTAGATDGGGTTAAAAQLQTLPFPAIAASWWEGDNLTDDRESDNQYVGYASGQPDEGNRRSAMWFDSAAIQAALAGATVLSVRVRLTVWEGGNNKTLVIGSHSNAAVSSSWNALSGKNQNRTRKSGVNEGSSPWIDLSAWGDKQGWATGALRGLLVGPGMTAGGALSNDVAYKFSYRGVQFEKPALRPVLEITFQR